MLMLLQLKRNIISNLRMKRTQSELLDGFKNLEVSFTTHHRLKSTISLEKVPSLLSKKTKKLKVVKLLKVLLPNHIKRKLHL